MSTGAAPERSMFIEGEMIVSLDVQIAAINLLRTKLLSATNKNASSGFRGL
jgi:hypothetical protein